MELISRLLNIAYIALLYVLVVQIINFFALRKLGRFPVSNNYPFVSIMVPARNEERNIERCISSLLNQDYPDYEVIVLDDESEDRTWEILNRLAEGNSRLRLMKGRPLPEDWIGKCWACHQLSENARGEYLLFVDADMEHKPNMLRSLIDAAHYYKADLVTGFPHEKVGSVNELFTIPLITWGVLVAIPYPIAFALRWPALSITIGQILLFRREAYEGIGGHTSVKDHVCEDMAIGRKIKEKGFRWRVVDAGEVSDCRMYTGLKDAVDGLSKTIFGAVNFRVLVVLFFSLLLGVMFCLPPWLLLRALSEPLDPVIVRQAFTVIVLSFLTWEIANLRFRMPWYTSFLYPFISALSIFIFIRSMYLSLTGKTSWKGRYIAVRRVRL